MAWTEQCKIAFKTNATVKLMKEKPGQNGKRPIYKVLRSLAKDSGIPFNTLRNWYYEKDDENVDTETGIDAYAENEKENQDKPEIDADSCCIECGNPKIFKHAETGKPYSKRSKFYGLCYSCIWKKRQEEAEALKIECPKCGHRFLP